MTDEELLELDKAVDLADEEQASAFRVATLARWEFGKAIKAERDANGGKQLPKGRMAELMELTGKSKPEISFRVQFADKYPTENEVSTAVDTCSSWTELRATFAKPKNDPEPEPEPSPKRESNIDKLARLYNAISDAADELHALNDLSDQEREALIADIDVAIYELNLVKEKHSK